MPETTDEYGIVVTGARLGNSTSFSDGWAFSGFTGFAGFDDYLSGWLLSLEDFPPPDLPPPEEPPPEYFLPEPEPIVVVGTVDIDQIEINGNIVSVTYTEPGGTYSVNWTYPTEEEANEAYETLQPHTGSGENIPVGSDGNWQIPLPAWEPAFDETLIDYHYM
ncbi:MAG: hypothetical protein ACRC14_04435 [Paracoccaceae bacterium]